MAHREFKDPLYDQFARVGHAVSSPKRIELLDLLSQGEKTVEQLAEQAATPVKNTSAHLRVLRQARLVETRRDGTHVHYRLAGEDVFRFLRDLQALARSRLAEGEQVARLYIDGRDELEPVSVAELRRRLRDGDVMHIGGTEVVFRAPAGSTDSTVVGTSLVAPALPEAQRRVLVALCRPYRDGGAYALPATNRQIAAELVLSVEAVKTHLRTLFQRFGVEDLPQNAKRARLVELAFETGAVTQRDLER
jgi:DNA-binding transcriptional ArsR family regulator